MAHHSFDNVLVWGVLKHTLPESHQRISEIMVEMWVKFAHGETPWEPFGSKEQCMIINESGVELRKRSNDSGRGHALWKVLDDHGLIADFSRLSEELCLRRSDLLSWTTSNPIVQTATGDIGRPAGDNVI